MSRPIRILHLEDEKGTSVLVARMIEAEEPQWKCSSVDTRESYVNALQNENFDIILGDYHLPDINGEEALKLAKEMRPDIPYILLSGAIGEEFAVDFMKMGAADYILKGNWKKIVPVLKRALQEKAQQQEREMAERELKESEERLRFMFQQSMDLLAILSPKGECLYSNPAWGFVLGSSPEVHKNIDTMIYPEDRGLLHNALKELQQDVETLSVNIRFVDQQKTILYTDMNMYSMQLNNETCVYFAARDITKQKSIETALQESQSEYAQLLDAIADAYLQLEMVTDETGKPCDYKILEVNAVYEKLTGVNKEAVIGKTFREIFPGETLVWLDLFGKVASTGEAARFKQYSNTLEKTFEGTAFCPRKGQCIVTFVDITNP